jgi:hypothetical protein
MDISESMATVGSPIAYLIVLPMDTCHKQSWIIYVETAYASDPTT